MLGCCCDVDCDGHKVESISVTAKTVSERSLAPSLHQMCLGSLRSSSRADKIPLESMCVFALDADVACLRSVIALVIRSPTDKIRRTHNQKFDTEQFARDGESDAETK